ncbi:E3 SUMO- ligase KIAA1586-like isoform X4, partial [Paramuricea clavata]
LSSISTFFHASGIRTRELIDAANAEGCCVLSLPRVFEVRWTEFTSSLIEVVLRSWRALVTYFKKSNEKEAAGFLSFLTKKDNLDLLTFIADLLFVFSRYQQQLQSDSATLIDMDRYTSNVKAKVLGLKETALLGGWVEALSEQVSEEEDGTVSLKGVELSSGNARRRRHIHHLYVTDTRDIDAIKNEIIESLKEFLTQRFLDQEDDIDLLKPFVNLQQSVDLKEVHKQFFKDLDLMELGMEYDDVLSMEDIEHFRKLSLRERFQMFVQSEELPNLKVAFARILAAKPHSADVERLISCSVALKSSGRSRMLLETENLNLYVHYNMPSLDQWDPKPAVMSWMNERAHRARDCPKRKQQQYFKGIFSEAAKLEEKLADCEEEPAKKKKENILV